MMLSSYNTVKEGVLFTLLFLTSIATMAQSVIKATVKQNGTSLEEALLTTDASDGLVCSFASDGTLIMTKGTNTTHIAELPMQHGAAMDIEFSNTASASIPNSQDNKRKVGFTDEGYATIYSAFQVTIPTGITVYKSTYVSGQSKLSLSSISCSVLPAATGVLIKKGDATPGDFTYAVSTSLSTISGNELIGSVIAIPVSEYTDKQLYTLAQETNKQSGFYKYTPATTPTCRAFMALPSSSSYAKSIEFTFDDDPTGIADIKTENGSNYSTCYNLSGQRVSQSAKGIVIIAGKKYLNR